jgi:hypothetical protein
MRQIHKGVSRAPAVTRQQHKNIQFPVVQTQLQISCPFTKSKHQRRSKKGKSFYTPNLFCPPLIIRTILEHNIMIAIWPFAVACYWNRRAQSTVQNVLYDQHSRSCLSTSLWEQCAGICNNKEIESTWKTQKSFNCGHITTSDCVSLLLPLDPNAKCNENLWKFVFLLDSLCNRSN